MSSSMIQIVILAGIALFLVLQLRRVLGTRDGFEGRNEPPTPIANGRAGNQRQFEVIDGGPDQDIADFVDPDSPTGRALAKMKTVEPSFNVSQFTGGAKAAYEMILMAFENGDVDTLRDFLSDDVYESFLGAVAAREDSGLKIEANFIGVRETKVADAEFEARWKERADKLAKGPTAAYARAKQALRGTYDNTLEDQLELEAKLQGECGKTRDFQEGVTAFLEKRPPNYEGR